MMILNTRSGYIPLTAIALIEHIGDDSLHVVHYNLGAGDRETVATEAAVNRLLNACEPDDVA
jgi:hypothetical protein